MKTEEEILPVNQFLGREITVGIFSLSQLIQAGGAFGTGFF